MHDALLLKIMINDMIMHVVDVCLTWNVRL